MNLQMDFGLPFVWPSNSYPKMGTPKKDTKANAHSNSRSLPDTPNNIRPCPSPPSPPSLVFLEAAPGSILTTSCLLGAKPRGESGPSIRRRARVGCFRPRRPSSRLPISPQTKETPEILFQIFFWFTNVSIHFLDDAPKKYVHVALFLGVTCFKTQTKVAPQMWAVGFF